MTTRLLFPESFSAWLEQAGSDCSPFVVLDADIDYEWGDLQKLVSLPDQSRRLTMAVGEKGEFLKDCLDEAFVSMTMLCDDPDTPDSRWVNDRKFQTRPDLHDDIQRILSRLEREVGIVVPGGKERVFARLLSTALEELHLTESVEGLEIVVCLGAERMKNWKLAPGSYPIELA